MERLWELDEDTKPPDVAGSHKMGLLTQPLGEVRTIRGHSRALGGSETLYGDSCWGRQRTKTFIHCPLVFFLLKNRERDRQTDRQTETERLTEKQTEIEKEKRGQREAERDVTEKDWVNMSKEKKRYTGFLTSLCNINLPFIAKCVPFDFKVPLGLCAHIDSLAKVIVGLVLYFAALTPTCYLLLHSVVKIMRPSCSAP